MRCHFLKYFACGVEIEEPRWKQSNSWCAEKHILVATHCSQMFIHSTRIKIRLRMLRSRCHQSFTSPRKRNVSPMKPHIVLSVHGVRSASRPRALTENTPNSWGTRNFFLVIGFECAFATDTLGDSNRRISMMVATDSIHGSIFCCFGKEKWWPGR